MKVELWGAGQTEGKWDGQARWEQVPFSRRLRKLVPRVTVPWLDIGFTADSHLICRELIFLWSEQQLCWIITSPEKKQLKSY